MARQPCGDRDNDLRPGFRSDDGRRAWPAYDPRKHHSREARSCSFLPFSGSYLLVYASRVEDHALALNSRNGPGLGEQGPDQRGDVPTVGRVEARDGGDEDLDLWIVEGLAV